MAAANPIELIFQQENETKNKMRFQEMEPVKDNKAAKPVHKDNAVVDKLYLSKKAWTSMGKPETLHVEIKAP